MLKIEGKTFMNIQEAVQWLLDNNALPFQSSANYVANTEIGLGTIANPSPAKVKIGSLILFADSKIATVTGLTESGFMVDSQYVNIKDALNYISNVSINASQHLIVTFSDGSTIDAGLLKQLSYFGIDASQHLIAYYNDGTTTDLGAIFSGNITISGDLAVTGTASGPLADFNRVTGDEIVEKMGAEYGFILESQLVSNTYAGCVKNGNKITFVLAFELTLTAQPQYNLIRPGTFVMPESIGQKLYKYELQGVPNVVSQSVTKASSDLTSAPKDVNYYCASNQNNLLTFVFYTSNLELNTKYLMRIEQTFLLGNNLAS